MSSTATPTIQLGTPTGTASATVTATPAASFTGAGTVFSSGGPTYDLLFTTVQNATISGPAAAGGAPCTTSPAINFTGTATRCLAGP